MSLVCDSSILVQTWVSGTILGVLTFDFDKLSSDFDKVSFDFSVTLTDEFSIDEFSTDEFSTDEFSTGTSTDEFSTGTSTDTVNDDDKVFNDSWDNWSDKGDSISKLSWGNCWFSTLHSVNCVLNDDPLAMSAYEIFGVEVIDDGVVLDWDWYLGWILFWTGIEWHDNSPSELYAEFCSERAMLLVDFLRITSCFFLFSSLYSRSLS